MHNWELRTVEAERQTMQSETDEHWAYIEAQIRAAIVQMPDAAGVAKALRCEGGEVFEVFIEKGGIVLRLLSR